MFRVRLCVRKGTGAFLPYQRMGGVFKSILSLSRICYKIHCVFACTHRSGRAACENKEGVYVSSGPHVCVSVRKRTLSPGYGLRKRKREMVFCYVCVRYACALGREQLRMRPSAAARPQTLQRRQ